MANPFYEFNSTELIGRQALRGLLNGWSASSNLDECSPESEISIVIVFVATVQCVGESFAIGCGSSNGDVAVGAAGEAVRETGSSGHGNSRAEPQGSSVVDYNLATEGNTRERSAGHQIRYFKLSWERRCVPLIFSSALRSQALPHADGSSDGETDVPRGATSCSDVFLFSASVI